MKQPKTVEKNTLENFALKTIKTRSNNEVLIPFKPTFLKECSCERVFSRMNLIKNDSGGPLKTDTLDCLST